MGDITVYFVGTAGAGKSTLVAAYDRWCKQHGMSTVLVNLDPGAEKLPYNPDVDVRDYVRLSEVMEEHGLGPNGAQIAAADMVALNLDELREELSGYRADQIIVDTPGQLELFVFRQSGKHIVENLSPGQTVVAYLLDPFLARTATGFSSQLLLAAATLFRFQEPMAFLLSKSDAVDEESRDTILAWGADPDALDADVLAEAPSMGREFAAHVARLLGSLGAQSQLIPVSGSQGEGLDEVYARIQQAVGQAEEGTPEYDTFLAEKDEPS